MIASEAVGRILALAAVAVASIVHGAVTNDVVGDSDSGPRRALTVLDATGGFEPMTLTPAPESTGRTNTYGVRLLESVLAVPVSSIRETSTRLTPTAAKSTSSAAALFSAGADRSSTISSPIPHRPVQAPSAERPTADGRFRRPVDPGPAEPTENHSAPLARLAF